MKNSKSKKFLFDDYSLNSPCYQTFAYLTLDGQPTQKQKDWFLNKVLREEKAYFDSHGLSNLDRWNERTPRLNQCDTFLWHMSILDSSKEDNQGLLELHAKIEDKKRLRDFMEFAPIGIPNLTPSSFSFQVIF
ncbi:MAG: hypothetical protein ACYTXE_38780 [Nostoc sp.]